MRMNVLVIVANSMFRRLIPEQSYHDLPKAEMIISSHWRQANEIERCCFEIYHDGIEQRPYYFGHCFGGVNNHNRRFLCFYHVFSI
jgi:hypothetical protein